MPKQYRVLVDEKPHFRPKRLPTPKQLTLLWMLWKGWHLSEAARKLHITRQGAFWRLAGLKKRKIVTIEGTAGMPVVRIHTDPHHFVGLGGVIVWREDLDKEAKKHATSNSNNAASS